MRAQTLRSALKIENHVHQLAIHFLHYNFVRIHQTLRCSPAMEAKVTDRLWSIEDMVALMDAREESAAEINPQGLDEAPGRSGC